MKKRSMDIDQLNARRANRRARRRALSPHERDKERAYQRAWAEKNREKLRAKGRAWYEANQVKQRENTRRWREKNPEKARADNRKFHQENPKYRRQWLLKKKYGITQPEWDALFEEQNRQCAVCETADPGSKNGWNTDHDHDTGALRGVLCMRCNVLIGTLGDTVVGVTASFQRILGYLLRPPAAGRNV